MTKETSLSCINEDTESSFGTDLFMMRHVVTSYDAIAEEQFLMCEEHF